MCNQCNDIRRIHAAKDKKATVWAVMVTDEPRDRMVLVYADESQAIRALKLLADSEPDKTYYLTSVLRSSLVW